MLVGCRVHYVEPAEKEVFADDPRGVWVAIRPTQCSVSGPWREDWAATDNHDAGDYPYGPGEITILQEYCSKQGILVFEAVTRPRDEMTCAACNCAARYIMFLLVREEDVDAMIGFGAIPSPPN
jgi:hypothetical protein